MTGVREGMTLDELRALCDAAIANPPAFGIPDLAMIRYHAAFDPSTVRRLLDLADRLDHDLTSVLKRVGMTAFMQNLIDGVVAESAWETHDDWEAFKRGDPQ